MRVAIDLRINVAKWYNVKVSGYAVAITERPVSAMNARCATSDRHVLDYRCLAVYLLLLLLLLLLIIAISGPADLA